MIDEREAMMGSLIALLREDVMIEQKLAERIRKVLEGHPVPAQLHALMRVQRGIFFGEGLRTGRKRTPAAKKKPAKRRKAARR